MRLELAGPDATEALGAALAVALGSVEASPASGARLYLSGPLGAGKTTLVRGLLRALGVSGAVRSPTYTLIEPYRCGDWEIMHYDLYRLADAEELELLGAREHMERGVLSCIEWPERAAGWLPVADLTIMLAHEDARRRAELVAHGGWGEDWLARTRGHEKC